MDFFQNPKYKPVTREELVTMKKDDCEKKIWNVIEKIVKQFYHTALFNAKLSDDTTFEFNINEYYMSYCNPEKTHELLNVALLPEQNADGTAPDFENFYISMAKKFINDYEDKIITKLLYYFPDCNFEIEHRDVVRLLWGRQRMLNHKIIIMKWDNIEEPHPYTDSITGLDYDSPDRLLKLWKEDRVKIGLMVMVDIDGVLLDKYSLVLTEAGAVSINTDLTTGTVNVVVGREIGKDKFLDIIQHKEPLYKAVDMRVTQRTFKAAVEWP